MSLKFSNGSLVPDFYYASLTEVLDCFAYKNSKRAFLGCLLSEAVEYAQLNRAESLIIGGSFLSDKKDPQDVDCAIFQKSLNAKYVSYRWRKGNNRKVNLDLKLCNSEKDFLVWCELFQLERGTKKEKPCVEIILPNTGHGSEFDPQKEDRMDYLSRAIEKEMRQMQNDQEGKLGSTLNFLASVAVDHDPTKFAKPTLGLLKDMNLFQSRSPKSFALDFRGISIDQCSEDLRHMVREKLRKLPDVKLTEIYTEMRQNKANALDDGVDILVDALVSDY